MRMVGIRRFGHQQTCGLDVELPKLIMKAFWEQKERFGFVVDGYSSGWSGTDHHSCCKSLSLYWHCDSSG